MAWLGEAMKIARYYRKTLFWMFALMGLIVVSTSVIYVHTVDQQLSDDYLRSSRAIARAIANSNIDLIVGQNYSALQSIIDQYVEIPGIAYVYVVDNQGTIIAHTFVPEVPSEITASYRDDKDVSDRTIAGLGNFSEVSAGIVAGEGGSVHVGMDKGHVALQVQTAIGNEVYLLTIIFVISVLASCALMYQVSLPLKRLGSYAWRSLSGEQQVTPPPSADAKRLLERIDEVGEIARLIRGASDRGA
jgi:sensor histidine kinase regulating citrate/malate metabolism